MPSALVESFAAYQAFCGFSRETIRRRTVTLTALERYLAPATLADATADMLTEYLSRWTNPRTRHAYRSDVAKFYKWASVRHLVATNPAELLDSVRVPKSLPKPIALELVPLVVASCPDDDTRLMCALAGYAGLRIGEIAALDAVDVTSSHLVVRSGKGRKDRSVPLHPVLRHLLAGRTGPLFTVTAGTVGRRIKAQLAHHGGGTAHRLRHSFGTELQRVARDLLLTAELMGHDDLATTKGYARLVHTGEREIAGMYHDAA